MDSVSGFHPVRNDKCVSRVIGLFVDELIISMFQDVFNLAWKGAETEKQIGDVREIRDINRKADIINL
ncbi:MAG: hypothetical protein CEN91_173 [Candidatus Berkelbacteria bacterium Licking1014_85]|uniref:Uncharacterized protein n=1 Tax=Candidatus Berkelbacteria bacterium Licking1014_85 TaxID=2017148 RepID=A0A554LL84_9BACT|nr:MAG: hypothetical protein CEN91_173 [Candidatus Berkelbacteria bacterium Licking1014_85]